MLVSAIVTGAASAVESKHLPHTSTSTAGEGKWQGATTDIHLSRHNSRSEHQRYSLSRGFQHKQDLAISLPRQFRQQHASCFGHMGCSMKKPSLAKGCCPLQVACNGEELGVRCAPVRGDSVSPAQRKLEGIEGMLLFVEA